MEFLSTNGTRYFIVNTYKTRFIVKCPTNNIKITYDLEIKQITQIYVEEIIEAVNKFDSDYHENIADELFIMFGGEQTLVANHHGVIIQTERK